MSFSFKSIIRLFQKKVSEDRSSIWTWLFLFRKIYLTKVCRIHYSQFGEDIVLKGFILRNINDKLEEGRGLVVDKDAFTMNLEHVLPQRFDSDQWDGFCAEDEDPNDYVHRIGNLTLLSSE